MMRLFIESQIKRALRKLSEINVTASGCILQTPYQALYILAKTELIKPKQLLHYLTAMRNTTMGPECMLKFCVLVHIAVQNGRDTIDPEPIQLFLAEMLQIVPQLMEKYELNQFKRDKSTEKCNSRSKSPTRSSSCNQSPAGSARSESAFVCKEVYLLTHVVRPYIAYLLKFLFAQGELVELEGRKDGVRGHEAWMLVNFLKLAISVTGGFTVIGRYFLSSYGHLVVLLTKALARDINRIMPLVGAFISKENNRLSAGGECTLGAIQQFVRMLEEISKLNEDLYTVYLGKYYARYLLDLPEPKWIIANSKQFDGVYRNLKVQRMEASGKGVKKRSHSALSLPKEELQDS